MTGTLFRREVIDARRHEGIGEIALTRPLSTRLLAALAVVVAVLVLLFLLLAPYTRRASVSGQLVPSGGLATVVAPMRGVVAELATEEGAPVRAGQGLAQITQPLAMVDGDDAIAALHAQLGERRQGLDATQRARMQLLDTQASGLRAQRDAARNELAQIGAQIQARRHQLALARQSLARMQQLGKQKFVSATEVEQQQGGVLEHLSQVQAMQRAAAATTRAVAQLEQALAELPGQRLSAAAEHRRALAQLQQEQLETHARGGQAVRAPVAGMVATQLVKAGQAVEAGQPLLSLLPQDQALEAELWVPSRSIGFVAPGDTVMLRYPAFPYQKFGHQHGTVRRVSRSALGPRELQLLWGTPTGSAEPYYRVIVSLRRQWVTAYGQREPLRPGMVLEADILGEQRRLIEWIFEPLYSVQGRVAATP